MWSVIPSYGVFRCQNSQTGNITDRSFGTHESAQDAANEMNIIVEKMVAENKKRGAERKAKRDADPNLATRYIDPFAD